jgi:DNA polymerase
MPRAADTSALVSLLEWYRAVGVDACLDEAATDWLDRGERPPGHGFGAEAKPGAHVPDEGAPAAPSTVASARRPASPAAQPARQFPTAAPDEAVMAARAAARSAQSLEALASTLAAFDGCGLKATAKNLCFYRGAGRARIMLIGEAPGREEDLEGKPFVGRAGKLLDKMLAAIGLGEAEVHITNIVYWRPPGNRTPTPQEAQVCRPFLERQFELVAPELVFLLGAVAAKHVLDVADGIMRLRGKWRRLTLGSHTALAMPSLHPAYLLRSPADKRKAWRDLLSLEAAIATPPKLAE